MSLNLSSAQPTYSQSDENQTRTALQAEDLNNCKVGMVYNKILLKDTATGVIKTLVITNGSIVIS